MKKIMIVLIISTIFFINCNTDDDFEGNSISGYSSKEYELTIINISSDGKIKEYIEAGSGFIEIKEENLLNKLGIWEYLQITLIREEGLSFFGMIPFSFIKLLDENNNELSSDLAEGDDLELFIKYNL